LEAALYLLGRGTKEVRLDELFECLTKLNFEGSVLELIEKMQKEKVVKLGNEEVLLTDYGLAVANRAFAKLLDEEPDLALSLLRACRFKELGGA